jgi:NAD(P)-dependent dehydrogenase (short-subunit alcohol dehydrogenase family)
MPKWTRVRHSMRRPRPTRCGGDGCAGRDDNLDLLVNNAGQFGPVGPIAITDPGEWWQTLEVNLRGPLYCVRAVLPGMLRRGHGRIINASSSSGFAAVPMLLAYSVSKAALYRLTENLAMETRGHGVTVFTIIPGLVRTAMSESALSCTG